MTTEPARQHPLCLRPGCGRTARARGLCDSCYQGAFNLVSNKRTTWEELEKNGKSLKSSRKFNSKIISWLLETENKPASTP